MGCQLWALVSRSGGSAGACTDATFRRLVLSLGCALFSRNKGMTAGFQHIMEHLMNRRWLLKGVT